jgi:hypothetical protein
MDQCSGLKGLTRNLTRHLVRRHSSQFVINQRKQLVNGFGVALFDGLEDLRDLTHNQNGSSGHIGVNTRVNRFLRSDGTSARAWSKTSPEVQPEAPH